MLSIKNAERICRLAKEEDYPVIKMFCEVRRLADSAIINIYRYPEAIDISVTIDEIVSDIEEILQEIRETYLK